MRNLPPVLQYCITGEFKSHGIFLIPLSVQQLFDVDRTLLNDPALSTEGYRQESVLLKVGRSLEQYCQRHSMNIYLSQAVERTAQSVHCAVGSVANLFPVAQLNRNRYYLIGSNHDIRIN